MKVSIVQSLLPVLLVSGMSLVGCNKTTTSTESQSAAKVDTAASQPTAKTGNTVKVAITSNTPPFAFMSDKGAPQGIDVEMMNEIAKLEGFNVEYVPTSWDGMFANLEAGTSDLAVSGISFTPERSEKYSVSKSYYFNPSAIAFETNKGNYKALTDLQGKRIAGLSGGKSAKYAASVQNAEVITDETPFLLYQKILMNRADAAIYDQPVWAYFAKQYPQHKLSVVALETADDPKTQTVVIAAKTKSELINKINDGIGKLQQQGKLAEIEKKYMGNSEGTKLATQVNVSASSVKPAA